MERCKLMSEYGYLNHSSTDWLDEAAIRTMFSVLPFERVVMEQLWIKGQKRRPAFDQLLSRLAPGDTLYIYSIDRLGVGVPEVVRVWKAITQDKRADIVVLDDPRLDSRELRKPTLPQVRFAAQKAFDGLRRIVACYA